MFAEADSGVLKESYGTLHLCTYLGIRGIQIVDAKWIVEIVGMVPFEYTHREANYSECYALVLSWYALIYLYLYSASICISGQAFPATGLTTALAVF
jgi:hypothetical protein